jgi:hypothetical protein
MCILLTVGRMLIGNARTDFFAGNHRDRSGVMCVGTPLVLLRRASCMRTLFAESLADGLTSLSESVIGTGLDPRLGTTDTCVAQGNPSYT